MSSYLFAMLKMLLICNANKYILIINVYFIVTNFNSKLVKIQSLHFFYQLYLKKKLHDGTKKKLTLAEKNKTVKKLALEMTTLLIFKLLGRDHCTVNNAEFGIQPRKKKEIKVNLEH